MNNDIKTLLGLAKAFELILKKNYTEADKQYFRDNAADIGNAYLLVKHSKQPAKKAFPKEQQEAIDKFIADNHFQEIEVEPEKPNYKIELVPTQKAINTMFKMLKCVDNNITSKTISELASKILNTIK